MKKGHRRTQSANIVLPTSDDAHCINRIDLRIQKKHQIPHLLTKCQENIKDKVCNIDSLTAQIKGEEDKMFNFGKGVLRTNFLSGKRPKHVQILVSIPQKQKQNESKIKKIAEQQVFSKNKQRAQYISILKISNKQVEKGRQVINESFNKIIKLKFGAAAQMKTRKLSLHQGNSKAEVKKWKHKKETSNAK